MANITLDTFLPFGHLFSMFRQGVKGAYRFGSSVLHGATQFNTYHSEREKLAAVLSSPAALKVFALQCDLFSLGKIYVYDEEENEIERDPFLDRVKRPNPFQTESQFLWDFMFWQMLGTAYCYVDSKIVDKPNKLYFLDPSKIEWPRDLEAVKDHLVFSDATIRDRAKMTVTYRYENGATYKFPLDRLIISTDLTNGMGNWYKGPSRLDALYKIVSNAEHALDAKNINLRYAGKFLVGSQNDVKAIGLGEDEKRDIESKIDSDEKNVWPLKAMVEIRRFVDDFKSLELGKSFLEDYFLIGSMYGIPRDVLEAYNSATYENQEKARAAHVNYCFDPKGNKFMDMFEMHFGYDADRKNICMSWDHLPFMQVFEKDRVHVQRMKILAFGELINLNIAPEAANAYLDTNFEAIEEEAIIEDNSDPETKAAQAALRGSVGGVQGILAIQASVAAGTTSYSSAISILTIIYGFTDEQAKNILGEEPQQTANEQEQNTGEQAEDQPGDDQTGSGEEGEDSQEQ